MGHSTYYLDFQQNFSSARGPDTLLEIATLHFKSSLWLFRHL